MYIFERYELFLQFCILYSPLTFYSIMRCLLLLPSTHSATGNFLMGAETTDIHFCKKKKKNFATNGGNFICICQLEVKEIAVVAPSCTDVHSLLFENCLMIPHVFSRECLRASGGCAAILTRAWSRTRSARKRRDEFFLSPASHRCSMAPVRLALPPLAGFDDGSFKKGVFTIPVWVKNYVCV